MAVVKELHIVGSAKNITAIKNDSRGISKAAAYKLAEIFQISKK